MDSVLARRAQSEAARPPARGTAEGPSGAGVPVGLSIQRVIMRAIGDQPGHPFNGSRHGESLRAHPLTNSESRNEMSHFATGCLYSTSISNPRSVIIFQASGAGWPGVVR